MGLIKGNDAFKIGTQIAKQLIKPRHLCRELLAKRRIGHKQYAFVELDGCPGIPVIQRPDIALETAECRPVAARVFDQCLRF